MDTGLSEELAQCQAWLHSGRIRGPGFPQEIQSTDAHPLHPLYPSWKAFPCLLPDKKPLGEGTMLWLFGISKRINRDGGDEGDNSRHGSKPGSEAF